MHAHQYGLAFLPFSLDEGNVLTPIVDLPEGDKLEMAILRRQIYLITHFDHFLSAQAISNQIFNRDNGHIKFLGNFHQLRQAGHCAIRINDLDERGGRVETRNAHQVNRGLGVTGTLEHALIDGAQRVDVSRTAEILRFALGVGQCADGHGAVVHRYAGGAAFQQVHRHSKRGTQHRGVVVNLHVQFQFMAALGGNGCTQHATALAQHEVDFLFGDFFGGDDKIALVLTVLVINDNNKLAAAQLLHGLVYGIQFNFFHSMMYM